MPGMRYQPQGRVKLNSGHPLARRVIEYLPLNGSVTSALNTRMGALGGGGSFRPGPLGVSLRGAGAGARASIPLDLTKHSAITIAFWLYWDAYANNDAFAFEFSNGFNTGVNGFYIDPNSSSAGNRFEVTAYNTGAGGANGGGFTRPSAGAWHRYCISIDRAVSGSFICCKAYVDGVPQVMTQSLNGVLTGNFGNSTLHLLGRNGTTLLGTGNLQELAIYAGGVSDAEALADYQHPYQLFDDPREDDDLIVAAAAAPNTYTLTAAPGTFGLSGSSASLRVSRQLAGGNGSFSLTGNSATLRAGRRVVGAAGVITLAGSAVTLRAVRRLAAAAGAFALTGGDAQLVYAPVAAGATIVASSGQFVLTGSAVAMRVTRRLQTQPGSFALAGAPVSIFVAGGNIDVSTISPARIVLFEGSGSRVTRFDGSGSRVTPFDSSGSRVTRFGGSGSKTVRFE